MVNFPSTILYFGEDRDFSDRWLLGLFREHSKVSLIRPGSKIPRSKYDLFVNRLYASAGIRYAPELINRTISTIKKLEARGVPHVNSSKGYSFELNRLKQYKEFSNRHIPFIETTGIKAIQNTKRKYLLKSNFQSRHKQLDIVIGGNDIPKLTRNFIAQPLIENSICYRTEFIGKYFFTFRQIVKIKGDKLTFSYIPRIVNTPLSVNLRRKLIGFMREKECRAFSIEYFLIGNNVIIVDNNMTSNYKKFFIKQTGQKLERAWLDLIIKS